MIIMPEPLATDETDSCSESPRSRPEKVRLKLPYVTGTKIKRRKKKVSRCLSKFRASVIVITTVVRLRVHNSLLPHLHNE